MEYSTLSARLATFAPPSKRSKSGWPHTTPSAEDLAKAGFYYQPQGTNSDNTVCFMCQRALDGWEKEDDPMQEHLKHSSHCGWAILMNISKDANLDHSNMEDPTGETITEARRATFASGWPHESKRGWTCKTEKMVEAGWHFEPTPESEDFVSCAYCKLSLDGWEPKDNPFDEHYRRSPDCPFFIFAGTTAPSKRPKAKKGRASRVSRASRTSKVSARLSTQSNMTLASEAPSIPDLDESIDTSTTSVVSTMSTASTATNKGKRKAAGGRAKSTKSKKTKTTRRTTRNKAADSELETDEQLQLQLAQMEKEVEQELAAEPEEFVSIPAPKDDEVEYPELEVIEEKPVTKPAAVKEKKKKEPKQPKSPVPRSPTPNSDIENAPPSTRPASVRPPVASPGQMMSTWTAADVEMIFQSTPAAELFDANGELSEEEKAMTVQEWIEHIAQKAEGNLKAEAENMVGVFEREGARAMTVLESIVCI